MPLESVFNPLNLDLDAADRFDVRSATIEDGLSSLFTVRLVALSTNPAVDFESVIGRNATFSIATANPASAALPSRWSGLISEINQLRSEDTGLSTYELHLAPRLWLLTRRSNCRVFQQLSDLDIAQTILEEWGIRVEVCVAQRGKPRKCRVQYQETDHAFVSRLLEAAGITYFFRRTADGSVLVLSDAPESGTRRALPLVHVNEPFGGDRLWATEFSASRRVRSGKLTFADHDHRLPNRPLLAQSEARPVGIESELEQFHYSPGAFRFGSKGSNDTPLADDRGRTRTDPDEARRIADQAAASMVARTRDFAFTSNALDLGAATVLKVVDHSLAERDGELLITHVTVTATHDDEPRVRCRAVSAAAHFAPDAKTPTPALHGIQMATVVGPAGEVIHCDEFGRVRVQFHWDRYGNMDELSSCWVPVNQAWAGDGLGSLNLPRVGQEVIVSFLGGNPEEPIIVGRTFTNMLRPPFSLPANKTQNGFKSASVPATGGYNELMFEDMAGSELLRLRAEKDMATRVNHDHALSVGRNRNAVIDVDDSESIGGSQKKSVAGNKIQNVLGQLLSTIGQDQLTSVLGNLLSMAGGDRVLATTGAATHDALTHRLTSQTGTTITCGQSMIHIGPDSIVIQSPKVLLNPGEDIAASVALGDGIPGMAS